MAKAKVVSGDQGSQEFDELRKCVHSILLILEHGLSNVVVAADATAATTALIAIRAAIVNGTTSGTAAFTTGNASLPVREVTGVLPRVKTKQMAPTTTSAATLDGSDKNY